MTSKLNRRGRLMMNPMISTRSDIADLRCRSLVEIDALAPSPYTPSTRARNP
jgi:hypothetical protein